MWPRLAVFIHPTGRQDGLYRCVVRKGWWGGPGTGGRGATLLEVELALKATDERERIAEALRAAADAL